MRPTRAVPLLIVLLFVSGCDLLLGPLEAPTGAVVGEGWSYSVVSTGLAEGLDLIIDEQDRLVASYVQDGAYLRLSRQSGDTWIHLDGPPVSGAGARDFTRLAADATGRAAVLFTSDSEIYMSLVDGGFGPGVGLSTVPAALRDSVYARPATFTYENASIDWGEDGQFRVVVGDQTANQSSPHKLWLFRTDGTSSWTLGSVGGSVGLSGTTRVLVSTGSVEHVVFRASEGGAYWWWRPGEGWQSRLPIPGSHPFLIQLRADDSSVLTARDGNQIKVAVENYRSDLDEYRWEARTAASNENLFWGNMDLILDDDGLPAVVYIVGPLPNELFQVWYTRLRVDGSWQTSLVAGALGLPTFNPFNVRMVRDAAGYSHILMAGAAGGDNHVLLHYVNDEMEPR